VFLLRREKMMDKSVPADLAKFANVNSAKINGSSILINPSVAEVVAQPSGFNWKVQITVEDLGASEVILEYLNYYVTEVRSGPGWNPKSGIGPVVIPITLYENVYHTGSKGIAIVGKNRTINLDVTPTG
jgi:hypothetical protein